MNRDEALRIGLASPADIRSWSFGEVKKPETINYRTHRPEKDGLFCERIFGPVTDWECACGKYSGQQLEGMVCDRCGVTLAHSRVRRQRMGHVELAAAVVHPWFFRTLDVLLDLKSVSLEKVIYYEDRIVVDPGGTGLRRGLLLSDEEYRTAREIYGDDFRADWGAWAIESLIDQIDLDTLSAELRGRLDNELKRDVPSRQKGRNLMRRLEVVESLRNSEASGVRNQPKWMVLQCLPIIPPDLRPLASEVQKGDNVNNLYGRIINRNNRLKKLVDLNAPDVIVINEIRNLQQSVDALLAGGRFRRFRESRLGKRSDHSACATAVVGPELKLHQCGLPRELALELFRPLVILGLTEQAYAETYEYAIELVRRRDEAAWAVLETVTHRHPVLISRSPARNRTAVQAFETVLCDGDAIRLPPLVWETLGGEVVTVHLPLTDEAQAEADERMTPANNLFSPADGQLLIRPSQDVVMGCYHLTASVEDGEGRAFADVSEVLLAYGLNRVSVHDRIRVRLPREKRLLSEHRGFTGGLKVEEVPRQPDGRVGTTVGRVLFNDALDARMPFYDLSMTARNLERVMADCHSLLGRRETIALLERLTRLGLGEATRSGLSIAADDLKTPANKEPVLRATDVKVERFAQQYERGEITWIERSNKVFEVWTQARDEISRELRERLTSDLDPLSLLARSGAAGGIEQVRQLCGVRGVMTKSNGSIIETPVRTNYREGLAVLEYFIGTFAMRREMASTVVRMADAAGLTRKLIDVAQSVVVTMHNCGTTQGVSKGIGYRGDEIERPLSEVIRRRVSRHTITNPVTGELIVNENEMVTAEQGRQLDELRVDKILVRSPMTCQAPRGVCRLCYGADPATGALVEQGVAVGIVAALSLGEPAARLTPRTFLFGDFISSLERLTELFEARTPDDATTMAEIDGIVRLEPVRMRGKRVIHVRPVDEEGRPCGEEIEHVVSPGKHVRVRDSERVKAGDPLTFGALAPKDVLKISGPEAVQAYLVQEIQEVYRRQRIEIDDRHVEIIVAQMLRKVQVQRAGDSGLVPGSLIDKFDLQAVNERLKEEGNLPPVWEKPEPALASLHLLGISEAAARAESFLAAACRSAAKTLAEAALAGKVDPLTGLTENVLLHRLIPAGSGFHGR